MTPKQERFVAAYIANPNATQAAIEAGYSPDSAKVQGSRLLTNADIRQAIDDGQRETVQKLSISAEDIAREAWGIAKNSALQAGARVSALALLAKRHPEFSDKQETKHSGRVDLSHLSVDDLKALLDG